jgi:hypothetical protein
VGSLHALSVLGQYLAQGRSGISGPHKAPTLQGRHEALGDFGDEAAAGALERGADEEPVAADGLRDIAHAFGNRCGRADELDIRRYCAEPFHRKLTQRLAAAPLGEFVERTLFAVGRTSRS